jgi:peptide/nickel transport system substrate-binding protein/glutathione transport system substrate-binding protein
MKRLPVFLALIPSLLFAAATPASEAGQPTTGGTLRYGMVTEVSSLDPHIYVGSSWKVLNMAFYDTLLTFNQDARLAPALAEAWESTDARTYLLRLRRGVRFHGGEPFTARDVKYSLERILDPKTGATLRESLAGTKVTVLDDSTVKLERPTPDATLLNVLALPEAAIVSADWMKTDPNVKVRANGTGPFTLKEYEPAVRAVAEKNPNYFRKGQPLLDRIEFRMIKNDEARVNALRTGAVDMIEFVPWKDIDTLTRQSGIKVEASGGAFMNLWFNAKKKPFDDPRVRRAVAFAIDREAISKAAFFGHGTPLYGPPTTPDSPFYNPELARAFAHDPQKAKALLKEAGIPEGFECELLVYQGLAIYTSSAQIIQANLKTVGLNARIKLAEWANVVESKNKGTYDVMVYGVNVKLPDPDAYAYYFGGDSTYWAQPIGFRDETIESLLKKGRALTSTDERRKVYAELERRIVELSPWVFINWRDQAQAYKDTVQGYRQLGGALSESGPGIALPLMWIRR